MPNQLNPRIKQLMTEAGYAAPEIAPRAQLLVHLLTQAICEHITTSNLKSEELADNISQYWRIQQ